MTAKTVSVSVPLQSMPAGTPEVGFIQVVLSQYGSVVETQNHAPVNPLSVTFDRAPGEYLVEAYAIEMPSGLQIGNKVSQSVTIVADVQRPIPSAIVV